MGFCRDIFFLPVRAYRRSIWVSAPASILLVLLQVGMTGNLPLLVVQSSPCSPTKAPLRSSLQQNVQPSLTHSATQLHLLGTNALRWAIVDSHGSNTLKCCSSSSFIHAPPYRALMQQIWSHGYFVFSAGGRRRHTYLLDRSRAHTTGLLSTALPTTAQHD